MLKIYKKIAKALNSRQVTLKRNRWAMPWQVVELVPGTSLLSVPQRLREMATLGYLEREFAGSCKAFTLTESGVKLAKE